MMPQFPPFLQRLDPEIFNSENYLVLDFEVDTSHGDFGRPIFPSNKLLLAVWRTPQGLVKSHWGNELEQQDLFKDIESADFIVAHNAIYELSWLKRGGYDISRTLPFDTQLGEYVLLGNLVSGHADSGVPPTSISLDSCAIRRGWSAKDPAVDILMGHGINPVHMPRRWLEDRCKQDVETTHALFLDQRRILSNSNRLPVLFTRCLLTPVLASIQSEGMQLDDKRVQEVYNDHIERAGILERAIKEITGGINTNSPKQLAEYIYDKLGFAELRDRRGNPKRTATGMRATGAKVLAALDGRTHAQRSFLETYKEQSKLADAISKSLNFFTGVCKEQGGHFYADFNQTRTATHRLSSSGIPTSWGSVQFQNLAKAFKRLFTASRKGWLIAETDGSGLEFRVAAFIGQDQQAMKDLSDPGFDPHITSAAKMEGREYAELYAAYKAGDKKVKAIRDSAKPATFAPLYGATKGSTKQEKWYQEFKRRYAALERVQKGWVSRVLTERKLVMPWGMTFFFPNARISSSGYVNVGNAVYNYPVQSLATAEIIPIAIVFLWHTVHALGLDGRIKLVNTVHDSVVSEIHPDVKEQYIEIAQECFTTRVYEYLKKVYGLDFNVKLGTETIIGRFWGEHA